MGSALRFSHAYDAYSLKSIRILDSEPLPISMQAEYSPVNVPNSFVNLTIPGYAQKSPNPWNTAIGVAYEMMTNVARNIYLIKKKIIIILLTSTL